MLVLRDVRISAFDSQRWVINTNTGHNLLVNSNTAKLFELIQSAETIVQATEKFNALFQTALTYHDFIELLAHRFGGYGILVLDEGEKKEVTGHYINFKTQLFSPKVAGVLAKPLSILYQPLFFWPITIGIALFLSIIYWNYAGFSLLRNENYLITIAIAYLSIFIHELGHIAACKQFKIRHGEIGFGFYLYVFPVLYADVTNIWQAERHQRIITNLAGIFSQLMYSSLLSCIYIFTGYKFLLFASMAVAASALWQFNPFVRYDGYWLLSDLTNTPNLLSKSSQVIKQYVSWQGFLRLLKSRGKILLSKKIFFLVYGLSNLLILITFAYYSIVRHGHQLLLLPTLMLSIVSELFSGRLFIAGIRQIPLVAVAFYIVAFRYFLSLGLNIKNKLKAT